MLVFYKLEDKMKVKAELEFEIPEDLIEDLRNNWGCGLASYLHDGIDISFNRKDTDVPLSGCELVGIKVLDFSSGTLFEGVTK